MPKLGKVIMIDDNPANNLICKTLIKMNDYAEVFEGFQNPVHALNHLQHLSTLSHDVFPDLIFLDINMPYLSGWEFLDAYKNLPEATTSKCKVFILSSSVFEDDMQRAETNQYVTQFLTKPLSSELLLSIYDSSFKDPEALST